MQFDECEYDDGNGPTCDLLSRLYQPREGVVSVGGENLNVIDMAASVAMMEQTPTLRDSSVRDNIRWGCDATDEEVEAVALATAIIGQPDTAWTLPEAGGGAKL